MDQNLCNVQQELLKAIKRYEAAVLDESKKDPLNLFNSIDTVAGVLFQLWLKLNQCCAEKVSHKVFHHHIAPILSELKSMPNLFCNCRMAVNNCLLPGVYKGGVCGRQILELQNLLSGIVSEVKAGSVPVKLQFQDGRIESMIIPPLFVTDIDGMLKTCAHSPHYQEPLNLSSIAPLKIVKESLVGNLMTAEMRKRMGNTYFVFLANLKGRNIVFENEATFKDLKALQDAQGGGPVLIQALAVDDSMVTECNDLISKLLGLDEYARRVNKKGKTCSFRQDEISRISTLCTNLYQIYNGSSGSITIEHSDIEFAHKWLAGFTDFLDRVTGGISHNVLLSYASADTLETLKMYVCADETMAQMRSVSEDHGNHGKAVALLVWLEARKRTNLPTYTSQSHQQKKRKCQ